MSELQDQLARVKLHKGLAPLTCIVSRQQFTGVRPLFQTFPARAVFQPNVPANQRRVLQEALQIRYQKCVYGWAIWLGRIGTRLRHRSSRHAGGPRCAVPLLSAAECTKSTLVLGSFSA